MSNGQERIGRLMDELVMNESEVLDLARLAQKHRVSLVRLGRWLTRATGVERMALLRAVGRERTRLLALSAGAQAAYRLLELAKLGDEPEVARKACVDLLRIARELNDDAGEARAEAREEEGVRDPTPAYARREMDRAAQEADERLRKMLEDAGRERMG